uniref:chitin synthase n=1 Tax=Myripristis murdjan TaxID=586833 RepID=A0A667XWU8_9TELE
MNLPCLSFRLQTSFLLLITLSNTDTQTVPADQKPFALLCVGCALIASSVLLLLKSLWKAKFKSSKLPARRTAAVVLLMEFLVSLGSAVLTIVAMPHLDIVTNVTILNSVAVLSAVLQVAAQCAAKERNRFIFPSLIAFLLILLGYVLFLVLYLLENESRSKTAVWAGLAVAGSFLISLNWWENYIRLFCDTRSDGFLKNVLHILSSLLRILVTGCVVGAYVPLSQMDWVTLTTVPNREMRIVVTLIVVQLVSSALCQWFAVAACKMHALRRCFILPLYSASLAVMAVLIIPVIIYFEDYRAEVSVADNSTFTDYCTAAVYERNQTLGNATFLHIFLDVTQTLCSQNLNSTFVILTDKWPNVNIVMSYNFALGLAAAWWLGLVLATLHIWFFKVHRIQRTQDLFIRRLYEGAFIEQSLLLNTLTVYLCATMWHETGDEMMNIIISIFRLDQYRPKTDAKNNDINIEAHIYFDDAFKDVRGSRGRHVNEYAETLVETIKNVYRKRPRIPDQRLFRTPYGGRLEVTMPKGNNLVVHFKDKQLIRHKKRWSQIMYLYYLLGWKLKQFLLFFLQKEMHNTYILALDGDTDFHPAAVMLLIDRLKMYPLVGAACGRIHPTGSGPMVWFQKFEYAVGHWLQKAAEHVIGCVLCSPGCFSLFRAAALMDNNVMKTYLTKSTEARHYIQYDQGEDRWLCTLLLKQGWRVEYNAASDAYTNAPEEFKEFYNQVSARIGSEISFHLELFQQSGPDETKHTIQQSIVKIKQPDCVYASCLPGSFTFLLNIDGSSAVVLAVIPPAIYLGLCFKVKSNTQITIAAVLSVFYAFLMLVVGLTIISSMVKEQTILTPSSIFVIAMSILYLITGLMHPQEFSLVFYGFLYILCIPSAYLLLAIYSMVNMNNVSWGTRETAPAPGAARPAAATPQTRVQQGRRPFEDETEFFGELQAKYLYPLPEDKEKQKKITNDLRELRNKITFAYFICNALWLVATFTLQFLQANIFIRFPKVTVDLELTEEFITVEPIGFMFILGFALLILIQFLAMLYHRFYTLIHFVAFEGTESRTSKTQSKQVYSTSITTTAITAIAHFFNKSVLVIYSIIIMISIFLRSRILKSMTPMRFCSQTC